MKTYILYALTLVSTIYSEKLGPHTKLTKAIFDKDSKAVAIIIKAGANVNEPNLRGETPLFVAAASGSLEIVEILLKKGAAVNQVEEENCGRTALMAAVLWGHLDIVKVLLNRKADPNAKTLDHCATIYTPLIFAVSGPHQNDVEIAEVLVDAGADTKILDEKGRNLLERSASARMKAYIKTLLSK